MARVAVIQATRGLIFSQAQSALERELRQVAAARGSYQIFRSFNLKIPDCLNQLLDEALKGDFTHILFSEEDTVIPVDALYDMIMTGEDIIAVDYGVAGWSCITRDAKTKEILWCGLGCTLVRRRVFDKVDKPYFRSDKQLLLNDWPETKWVDAPLNAYGGQDIWFFMHAREKGFRISQFPGECTHLQLESLGQSEINNGLHKIVRKPVITKYQTLPI